jgi:cation:H+ antiporter
MTEHLLLLLGSFVLILVGSELFTNGIEWAGHRFEVAEAAVGSLLAAVGTALPETFVPVVAILMPGVGNHERSAVGLGAIIGAPLMLSTVALMVMAAAALTFKRLRGRIELNVSRTDARRDLIVFGVAFSIAVVAGLGHPPPLVRHLVAVLLIAIYIAYAVTMLRLGRAEGDSVEHGLYFESIVRGQPLAPRLAPILLQVAFGMGAILLGARVFVDQLVLFARHVGVSPGVLSLLLSPLATELPEKYNSVIWIRQRKDRLALANITGAMVFQSCIPVGLGVAFTSWHLSGAEIAGAVVALGSAGMLIWSVRDGRLRMPSLMLGGAAYLVFVTLLLAGHLY